MAEMTEEVKARLRDIQARRRAESTAPGRGTLRGCDLVGWMGSLDAIADGRQEAEDARVELTRAAILVPYVDGQHVPPGSQNRLRRTYAWTLADHEVRVEPRRVVDPYNPPRLSDWEHYRWARLHGITSDREAHLAEILGGRTVQVRRNRGPIRGEVMEPTRFYPADQIVVLFRMVWFGRAEDRGTPAYWMYFREAFSKYVLVYTDTYARVNRLDGERECEPCGGSGEIQVGRPPAPSWRLCENCNGLGKVSVS